MSKRKAEFYIGGHAVEHMPAWHSPMEVVTPNHKMLKNKPRVERDKGALGASVDGYEQSRKQKWRLVKKKK